MRAMSSDKKTGAPNSPDHATADADRTALALAWAADQLGSHDLRPALVAGDASFRRYLRVHHGADSWILMDAPPERENSAPFVDVTGRLLRAGIHAPALKAVDLAQGFLLLEDLGDTLLRERLDSQTADEWFPRLLDLLADLATRVDIKGLPDYNRKRLQDELELFPEWYLRRHLGLSPDCAFFDYWEDLCTMLMASAEAQPQVFVHRDFHSCNLLQTASGTIGVIDYQDALHGPLSYDLASLLWDRYLPWPREQLEQWMERFRERVAPQLSPAEWQRQVDWMGIQRNLKIVGIFARLHHRDGKSGYLEMIPRFRAYLLDVLPRYERFRPFLEQLEKLPCAP
jgi:aminoglycoside/choline kinase family phosphotransferase